MTLQNTMFSKDCPIGHTDSLIDSGIILPKGSLLVCRQCGHMVNACSKELYDLTMQEFNTIKDTSNADSVDRGFRLHSKRLTLIRRILGLPAENICILDIGCSSGDFLKSAKKLGFNVEGVEPASNAVAVARSYGFTVYEGGVEHKEIPRNYFNALTTFEVIEHLDNPIQFLKQCKDILKPGGILVIGTGNTDSWTQKFMGGKWEYYDISKHGGHISFFNTHSLKLLIENAGFEMVNLKTRCVKFLEKGKTTHLQYRLVKILTELLNFPAQLADKGHDMLAICRRPIS